MGNFIDLEGLALGEVEAWDGEGGGAPDPGDYIVQIAEFDNAPSKGGRPMMTVKLQIVSNADGSESAMSGRSLFSRYMLDMQNETNRKRLACWLDALALERTSGFDQDEQIGKQYAVTVVSSPYTDGNGVQKIGAEVRRERAIEAEEEEAPPQKTAKGKNGSTAATATTPPAAAAKSQQKVAARR